MKEVLEQAEKAAVLAHKNADPDALASAVLASRLLDCWGIRSCIFLPEGLSKASKRIAERYDTGVQQCTIEDVRGSDALVIVDSGSLSQLGDAGSLTRDKPLVLIDHHSTNNILQHADAALYDPNAGSTTELALAALLEECCSLDRSTAMLALHGIMHDTRRLARPGTLTLYVLEALRREGITVEATIEAQQDKTPDLGERVARVKGLSRMKADRACRDLIVCVTHIGSYEGSVARAMLDAGCDIAVVIVDRREGYRIAVRASKNAQAKGITADWVARYLAEKYGGEGGGHKAAAMLHAPHFKPAPEDAASEVARTLPGRIGRACNGVER